MSKILASDDLKARKRALARQRFPGETIWQCDRCGHASAFEHDEIPGPMKCDPECGGTFRKCESEDT